VSENTFIARQRLGKHVPVATNRQATIEMLLSYNDGNGVFCVSAPRLYNKNPRVEAGSNTSTMTLRVVGGDEKGSLKTERVKFGRETQGTPAREGLRWRGPAAYKKDRTVLSLERASHKSIP
jgi:hypothetical protein